MNGAADTESITVYNASENNLKHLTVSFPLGKFTCVTGPSGCGKSSLLFDTIYAESQRSLLKSMSGNLFGQKLMDKPRVDRIDNLRPALNISQKYYNVNPRSTVGTVTDISYALRTLFAFLINQEQGRQLDMNYFSPNNPASCCPRCSGLGEEYVISEQALIPDREKSLESGGILYYKGSRSSQEYKLLEAVCACYGIDIHKKVGELTESERYALLYRTEPHTFLLKYKTPKGRYKKAELTERGAMVELEEKLKEIHIPSTFASISKYLTKKPCSLCQGKKLNRDVCNLKVCGVSIGEAEQFSMTETEHWCRKVREQFAQSEYFAQIEPLLAQIERRVQRLIALELDYISIGRSIPSLSDGELQRVRLAAQLDVSLSGLLYILDEPCRGLHDRNVRAMIDSVKSLTARGNTVIAIEHNKRFIAAAEHVIEMGPVGGPAGGYILSEGKEHGAPYDVMQFKTARKPKNMAELRGISYRNLKNLAIHLPIGSVTCISGVSGSGKSSLSEVIEQCCARGESEFCKETSGLSAIKKVARVSQSPIGKTARSTVVSYLGIYDAIREAFADMEDAKARGLSASDFSMNVQGGRCECCQGTGRQKIELSYLPETYIICPECKGRRFHHDILEVKYKNHTIEDVLNQSIHSLLPIFEDKPSVFSVLSCMEEIGMGYVSLGQMSLSLSGGEAQRIKLAKHLGAHSKGGRLLILDEPTSGLGEKDVDLLRGVIDRLADNGDTLVIIEHRAEFIAQTADHLIDLGTCAGNAGGTRVLEGDVRTVMSAKGSSWEQLMQELSSQL